MGVSKITIVADVLDGTKTKQTSITFLAPIVGELQIIPQRMIRVTKVSYDGNPEYGMSSVRVGVELLEFTSGKLFTSVEYPVTCQPGNPIRIVLAKRDTYGHKETA